MNLNTRTVDPKKVASNSRRVRKIMNLANQKSAAITIQSAVRGFLSREKQKPLAERFKALWSSEPRNNPVLYFDPIMTNKGRIECSSPESKLQYLESSSSDSSPDKRTLVEANNAINLFNEGWPPETKRSTTVSPNKDSAHNAETKLDIEETSSVSSQKHSPAATTNISMDNQFNIPYTKIYACRDLERNPQVSDRLKIPKQTKILQSTLETLKHEMDDLEEKIEILEKQIIETKLQSRSISPTSVQDPFTQFEFDDDFDCNHDSDSAPHIVEHIIEQPLDLAFIEVELNTQKTQDSNNTTHIVEHIIEQSIDLAFIEVELNTHKKQLKQLQTIFKTSSFDVLFYHSHLRKLLNAPPVDIFKLATRTNHKRSSHTSQSSKSDDTVASTPNLSGYRSN